MLSLEPELMFAQQWQEVSSDIFQYPCSYIYKTHTPLAEESKIICKSTDDLFSQTLGNTA